MATITSRVLRLHVWGSNPTLPTLDPTSLYAATLLLATFGSNESVRLQLTSASTSLSTRVPLLQVLDVVPGSNDAAVTGTSSSLKLTTTELLDEIDAIRAFCVAAGLDADLVQHPEKAARALALHAMMDDQLLDLTLHSLFSFPTNYRTVTAPSYSASGSNTDSEAATFRIPFTESTIPSRLRNAVQQRLTAVGIWGVGGTEAATHAQESNDLANRAGIVPTTKSKLRFGPSAKDAVKDEFEKTKLANKLNDLLAVLQSCVGDDEDALLGGSGTSSLDAHVFAALAPLLYSTPTLTVQLLSRKTMTTSFPKLLDRMDTLRDRYWPEDRSRWPSWASTQDLASSPPSLSTDSSTATTSSWWPFFGLSSTSTTQDSRSSPQQAEKASTRPQAKSTHAHGRSRAPSRSSTEDSRLRWGRILWISSAVIGLVGYTFASGIVSVEWVDPQAETAVHTDTDSANDDDGRDIDPDARQSVETEEEVEWEEQSPDDLDDVDVDDDDDEDEFEDDD